MFFPVSMCTQIHWLLFSRGVEKRSPDCSLDKQMAGNTEESTCPTADTAWIRQLVSHGSLFSQWDWHKTAGKAPICVSALNRVHKTASASPLPTDGAWGDAQANRRLRLVAANTSTPLDWKCNGILSRKMAQWTAIIIVVFQLECDFSGLTAVFWFWHTIFA